MLSPKPFISRLCSFWAECRCHITATGAHWPPMVQHAPKQLSVIGAQPVMDKGELL